MEKKLHNLMNDLFQIYLNKYKMKETNLHRNYLNGNYFPAIGN